MDKDEDSVSVGSSDGGSTGWRDRLTSTLDAGREMVSEKLAAGKDAVQERLEERKRRDLLCQLGEIHYRAATAGSGVEPDPAELKSILDALAELEGGDADG